MDPRHLGNWVPSRVKQIFLNKILQADEIKVGRMHDPPTSRAWFGRAISHQTAWRPDVVKLMALATTQNKKI